MTILAHGASAGVAPTRNNHQRAKRGDVFGWSTGATRRNTRFLRTVDHDRLTGQGYAVTLTVKDCPLSPDDWKQINTTFFNRLRRMGLTRLHWVVEWQRRGVPHLHLACWFNHDTDISSKVIDHWIAASIGCRAHKRAQTCKPITGFDGWAKYVAKHSARGAAHYQRCSSARPVNWETSGRMWGKLGDWPTIEPIRYEIPPSAFHALRRLFRGWRKAQARTTGSGRLIRYSRTMLTCHDPRLSGVRGVSEWIDRKVSEQMIGWLINEGHYITINADANERIANRLHEGLGLQQCIRRAATPECRTAATTHNDPGIQRAD